MTPLFRAFLRAAAVALLLCFSAGAARSETAIPAVPNAWVTDAAGLLTAQTVSEQNVRLRQYERKTGHQILVYIAPTTGGVPIEDWSVSAFKKWQVGRKGLDDGLVLFIFSQDRTLHIEVGYGLESKVPDVLASRIIRNTITPALQAHQPDRGVVEGIDGILALTGAESAANAQPAGDESNSQNPPLGPFELVLIALGLIGFVILAIRSPWMALFFLVNIFGGRGGGMSGEGGFSGGGGRSGGGGASGRW
jgi:uncharacterized protein